MCDCTIFSNNTKISANINTQALGVKEEEEEKGGERERERERGNYGSKIVSECETPKVKEGSCTCYVVIVRLR